MALRVQFREVGKKPPEAFSAVCKTEWRGVEGGISLWCSAVEGRGRHYPTLLGWRSQFYPEQYLPHPMPQLSGILIRCVFQILTLRARASEDHVKALKLLSWWLMARKCISIFEHDDIYIWLQYQGIVKRFVGWKFLQRRGKQSPPLLCAATVGTRNAEQIMYRRIISSTLLYHWHCTIMYCFGGACVGLTSPLGSLCL